MEFQVERVTKADVIVQCIRFLKTAGLSTIGDVVTVVEEDDSALYYYDDLGRWCFVWKVEEGDVFEYVELKMD